VLVLDVLDDRVPAAVVVDEVTVAWCVDNVQAQSHAVLLNHVGDSLDLGGLSDGFCGRKTAL
jgi:thiamine biosynthesis lipoprotein ApbE